MEQMRSLASVVDRRRRALCAMKPLRNTLSDLWCIGCMPICTIYFDHIRDLIQERCDDEPVRQVI